MNTKSKKLFAVLALLIIVAGCFCLVRFYLPYREQQQQLAAKERQKIVSDNKDICYPGKTMGQVLLSGYTKEEIADMIKRELLPYEKTKAIITVDGKQVQYKTKEIGKHIFYQCSNKKKYKIGEEDKLAAYLVSLDKDLSNDEQYDIIKGDSDGAIVDVTIQCECDEKALTSFIKKLSKRYDTPVTNSRITASYKVTPAKSGKVLDTTAIADELRTYLNRQTTHDFSGSYKTETIDPTWYPKDLKKVNKIVSRYSTTFTDGAARGYNIHLAAKRLNGICLLPGEKISFLDTLYDNSDRKSYKKSAAYYKGKVVQATGGGICQVSTTAYQTFLRAGIIPEKRYPHSMPVGYEKWA